MLGFISVHICIQVTDCCKFIVQIISENCNKIYFMNNIKSECQNFEIHFIYNVQQILF